MKILAFSDSHGYTLGMYDAIEREAPDAVIHLGDCVDDARDLIRSYPSLTVWHIRGNNDFEPDVAFYAVVSPGGVPMYLTHGHKERVSWNAFGTLPRRAREAGCEIALYGHTHRVLARQTDGVLLLNPGSISLPRGGPPSYARLTVAAGELCGLEFLREDGQVLGTKEER